MKLTDEGMARALGYTVRAEGAIKRVNAKRGVDYGALKRLPKFTTDLNVVTAEIEERGGIWDVEMDSSLKRGYFCAQIQHAPAQFAKTAPLALCAALLAYLKEHP